MIILDASPTPARGFLQQPHFIGLTIFLLYWTSRRAPTYHARRNHLPGVFTMWYLLEAVL